MVRGTKKPKASGNGEADPEAVEHKRLKRLSFSNKTLSETPAKSSVYLNPSNTVLKHHDKNILKKSQRKRRYLFSFPGLIAPISGGKIGELKNLGTKSPILYHDFPQIVFSDAWWIGRKEDNSQEAKLEFPKELYEGQQAEYNFKGGAGAISVANRSVSKVWMQCAEQHSPKTPYENNFLDSENNAKDTKEVLPVRCSNRTARRAYKFVEFSSGDDSSEISPDPSEPQENVVKLNAAVNDHNNKENHFSVVVDNVNKESVEGTELSKENKECTSGSKPKKVSQFASATASEEVSSCKHGSLVQTTFSTLFKQEEEKDEGSRKKAKGIKDKDPGKYSVTTIQKAKELQVYKRRSKGETVPEIQGKLLEPERTCQVRKSVRCQLAS